MSKAKYKRIVLKLSGESFSPSGERGISMEEVVHISKQIFEAQKLGCEIAVVIGGGNIKVLKIHFSSPTPKKLAD